MDELAAFDKWLTKTEDKLDGGKIQRPGSIVDACQALSKARDLRAEFEKREKPLSTAKELIGEDPELNVLTTKCERIKKLADNYLSKVEALCVLWASGQVNADLQAIEKALQASGSKIKMTADDLKACVSEIQAVLVV
ncbi:uncharacterized protein LOC111705995 [Eurytemora carolleeae]|uniref:uncharacterized protein LOC111705995 n=1 Tax=Eurytemora carolleeae TaxID=1294199 RepID=UPI000C757BFD|nr:uncharacterized protein LOC111705995 [Eurytemora carolleeae]|eukprot:XP_023334494.1 uncharacterized protein LOC111705995 [Eurytemora affinis]